MRDIDRFIRWIVIQDAVKEEHKQTVHFKLWKHFHRYLLEFDMGKLEVVFVIFFAFILLSERD